MFIVNLLELFEIKQGRQQTLGVSYDPKYGFKFHNTIEMVINCFLLP